MDIKILAFVFLLGSGIAPSVKAADAGPKKAFVNESEAGIVVATGNARSQTFNFKQLNTYEWVENLLKFEGRYLKSSSRDLDSAKYWSLGLRYERILSDRFSLFLSQAVESDIFAGYLQRYNTDVGGKYALVKSEEVRWNLEAGYRYMAEHRFTQPDQKNHFGRIFTEVSKDWTKSVTALYWLEYLANFTESKAYRINTELSLTAVLTDILSVKSAYLLKFNNVPSSVTAEKTDTLLTTSLVAKF